jgi:hypothetical protein
VEQESCVGGDKNQRGKDVVVLNLSYKREFWHNSGYHIISIVAGPHSPVVLHS